MPPDTDLMDAPTLDAADAVVAPESVAKADPGADKAAAPVERPATDKTAEPIEKDAAAAPAKGKARAKADAPADAKPAAKTTSTKGTPTEDDPLGLEEDDGDARPQAAWPDDWREKMADGDEKLLKELKRFTSVEAYAKSQRALRQKLSSGEYKRVALPENATPEEKAAWRAENDIPEKPEDYGYPEIKGFEWNDADKTVANGFLAHMHEGNLSKAQAQHMLSLYPRMKAVNEERVAELNRMAAEAREDALRTEWGPKDYRPHIKLANDTYRDDEFVSPGLRDALSQAIMPDGTRLILNPELTRFFAERGLERRGPGGLITGEQGAQIGSRIDEIKKIRATDIDKYYADGLDSELLELTQKQEATGRRGR